MAVFVKYRFVKFSTEITLHDLLKFAY